TVGVSVADIERARQLVPIVSVQNRYNLVERRTTPAAEQVLDHCERAGIAFIPWFPLLAGDLAKPRGPVARVAGRLHATPSQVALAWLLRRSPVMLPIPGTSRVCHVEENVAAAAVTLMGAAACNDSQSPRPRALLGLPDVGTLAVTVTTSGSNTPSGYTVTVDGSSSQSVGATGVATFLGLPSGSHTVLLSGVPSN